MMRALSVLLAVLVIMLGLTVLPGPLPGVVWGAGLAGTVAGLFLVFRALPEDSPRTTTVRSCDTRVPPRQGDTVRPRLCGHVHQRGGVKVNTP